MAEPNIELVRDIYPFNWAAMGARERGLAVFSQVLAPGFELTLHLERAGGVRHGMDGLRIFFEAVEQDFDQLLHAPGRFIDTGEQVVVLGELFARGRTSGLALEWPFGHVWTIGDAGATRLEAYLDHGRTLEAAGISD
jgi:ketosteroid isomerase-like protein